MSHPSTAAPASERELVLTRLINAPREKVYRAWTDPELLKQWFAPKPYTTPIVEIDVRVGGSGYFVMRGADGKDLPNRGVYLEVVPNEKLVSTDAYVEAWEPSEKSFMTLILTFEDEGGKTRYTARVRHWTVADREAHEKMGFHAGWGPWTDQLEALTPTTRGRPGGPRVPGGLPPTSSSPSGSSGPLGADIPTDPPSPSSATASLVAFRRCATSAGSGEGSSASARARPRGTTGVTDVRDLRTKAGGGGEGERGIRARAWGKSTGSGVLFCRARDARRQLRVAIRRVSAAPTGA